MDTKHTPATQLYDGAEVISTAEAYDRAAAYQQLVKALKKAISEADGWHESDRGGPCPDLDAERALLRSLGEE